MKDDESGIELTKIDELVKYRATAHKWKVTQCLKCNKNIMYRKVRGMAAILVKNLDTSGCEHIFQDGELTYYFNPHLKV